MSRSVLKVTAYAAAVAGGYKDTYEVFCFEMAQIADILSSLETAKGYVEDSEAYALGTRDGVPVTEGDVAYEKNSKYFAESITGDVAAAEAAKDGAIAAENDALAYKMLAEAFGAGTKNGAPLEEGDTGYNDNANYYSQVALDVCAHPPCIDPTTHNWKFWNHANQEYVDSEISAVGPKGDTGATGATGATGPIGATPQLSVGTVETLDPGMPAYVTISGPAESPILGFGIPEGDPGNLPIDDTAGLGDTLKVFSADKVTKEVLSLEHLKADESNVFLYKEAETGSVATAEDAVARMVRSMLVDIVPVQSGSGAASPSNIRPISGSSNLILSKSQKFSVTDGSYIDSSGNVQTNAKFCYTDAIPVKTGDIIRVVGTRTETNSEALRIHGYVVPTYWRSQLESDANSATGAYVLEATVPSGVYYVKVSHLKSDTGFIVFKSSVKYSMSTAEGGQVYGGTAQINRDGNYVSINIKQKCVSAKDLTWEKATTQNNSHGTIFTASASVPFVAWSGLSDAERDAVISNALVHGPKSPNSASAENNTFWWDNFSTMYVCIWGTANGGSSLSDFTTFLNTNNVVFVGKIRTIDTMMIRTDQFLTLDDGHNDVCANTGDITYMQYAAEKYAPLSDIATVEETRQIIAAYG